MTTMKYTYKVAICESTEGEDLEAVLNENAEEGWELFMLFEGDSRSGKPQYYCVLHKLDDMEDSSDGENIEITDFTDFKKRIEKIYNTQDNYNHYITLQKQLVENEAKIQETKKALDSTTDDKERAVLNDDLQEKIDFSTNTRKKMHEISNHSKLYDRVKSDKITIYLSDELIKLTEMPNEDNLVASIISQRQDFVDKYGYVVPNIRYSDSAELEAFQYRIDIRDVPAAYGFAYPGFRMFLKGQNGFNRKPRGAVAALDPLYKKDVYWVSEEKTKDFWDKGYSAAGIIAKHALYTSLKYVHELLDYNDINKYSEKVSEKVPELAETLIPDVVSMGELKYIIGNLIREKVSIKDIALIYERIMDYYNFSMEKETCLEKLRVAMKRQICHAIADTNNTINIIEVSAPAEKYMDEKLISTENIDPLISLSKEEAERLISFTEKYIEKASVTIENTAILCTSTVRQPLFTIYEEFMPGLAVLAPEEIATEFGIEVIGSIEKRHILEPKEKQPKSSKMPKSE